MSAHSNYVLSFSVGVARERDPVCAGSAHTAGLARATGVRLVKGLLYIGRRLRLGHRAGSTRAPLSGGATRARTTRRASAAPATSRP